MHVPEQFQLLDNAPASASARTRSTARSGTFVDNMKLPVHRWFRYSAGFSAEWAEGVIASKSKPGRSLTVLDPFAGAGTTLLAAAKQRAKAVGLEQHAFVARIGKAKLLRDTSACVLIAAGERLLDSAVRNRDHVRVGESPDLMRRCYSADSLASLEALRGAWLHCQEPSSVRELLWLAITSILRSCSGVGTAQWQYVLPNKSKYRAGEPFTTFRLKVREMAQDIQETWYRNGAPADVAIREADARDFSAYSDLTYDLVVTSPPYPNNYDYADATRIEMTFWREVTGWSDLHSVVRHRLVRSCSQHAAAEKLILENLLCERILDPIARELSAVCNTLAHVRMDRGGKKTYHTMIAAYFLDLAHVLRNLSRSRSEAAEVCMVIGDSAPYGIHVPADRWLAELAQASGFAVCRFEKLRDRNIKWKNRKHRVPLKEGLLWLQ